MLCACVTEHRHFYVLYLNISFNFLQYSGLTEGRNFVRNLLSFKLKNVMFFILLIIDIILFLPYIVTLFLFL
jgi:hypothetical protein